MALIHDAGKLLKRLLGKKEYSADHDSVPLFFGDLCFAKLKAEYSERFNSVLDIGSGGGQHAERFRELGKTVTEIDFGTSV